MTDLPIFEQVPKIDASMQRQASTYTDYPEPEHGRIRRVWDVEPIPLAEVKAARKVAATELRWQKEVAGITIGGVSVATDDRSKTLILGKRAKST
ncbi:hypothetical protein [Azospirillum picis]|uniref:Uncharacterized protein n=1 Tax=Azospirillum picis TaxID=488438 RepID=A0ABU0MV06_9PROT|nr:hypothetical protein [Azospirillum picis]MBP2303415.1 hypothetical protein [Azospirillum picis]MDQ0537326.1 hypothetical protein [Azospirillum picis]